jgi:hypothetical protein
LYEKTIKYTANLENDASSDTGFVSRIRASYECFENCSKESYKNDIYWLVQGSNEYILYENKPLDFDPIAKQFFTQLDEEKWSEYPNKNVFCLIYPIINNKRSAIPIKTEYFFVGFVLEIDNKKVHVKLSLKFTKLSVLIFCFEDRIER